MVSGRSAMRDYGLEAQQAAEQRLEACWEALDQEGVVDSPECAPFCGCRTCEIREVLDAAWPLLMEAARAELTP